MLWAAAMAQQGGVCVCVCFSTAVKVKRHSCVCRGESEETFVLLPCSCGCVALLSECAVILGPNVCVVAVSCSLARGASATVDGGLLNAEGAGLV